MTIGRIPSVEGGIQPTIFDAKADLLTATANDTPARLAVGSNNQVLTADSSTATGLKWATPSSGALVLTGSSTFSGSSSIIISNCFSSTYDYYVMYMDLSAASGGGDWDVNCRMRTGSTSASSSDYTKVEIEWLTNAGSPTIRNQTANTSFSFAAGSTTYPSRFGATLEFIDPGIAQPTKTFAKNILRNNANTNNVARLSYGQHNLSTAYDGIEVYADSPTTLTGTIRVYGYAKS